MIKYFNNWINKKDININYDIKLWKLNKLKENNINISINNIDEWKFIGLYQTHKIGSWLNWIRSFKKCNNNNNKILCFMIDTNNHLHPRDIIIIHKSCDILIGIHGSHLINSIFMYNKNNYKIKNKYIIEILPQSMNNI